MKIRIGCLVLAFTQIFSAQIAFSQTDQPGNTGAQDSSQHDKTGTEARDSVLLGYTKETSAKQKDWEKKYRDGIVPSNIRENMRRLSARPHNVGSPYDKDNAEWILSQFKAAGWDAKIETFNVLFPTPKQRVLELIAPKKFVAKLQEPVLPVDPTSNQTS